jgi:hypothetical protein
MLDVENAYGLWSKFWKAFGIHPKVLTWRVLKQILTSSPFWMKHFTPPTDQYVERTSLFSFFISTFSEQLEWRKHLNKCHGISSWFRQTNIFLLLRRGRMSMIVFVTLIYLTFLTDKTAHTILFARNTRTITLHGWISYLESLGVMGQHVDARCYT